MTHESPRPLSRLTEWHENPVGDRDLTRWHTAAGAALVRFTQKLVALAHRLLPAGLRSRLVDREPPWLVLLVTAVLGGALAVLATAASAEIYDGVEDGEGVTALDRPVLDWVVLDWVVSWRTPRLDDAITAYTDLGSMLLMVPIVLLAAGLLWWLWRRATPAILFAIAIAAAGSLLMIVAGKHLVGRVRLPQELAVPPCESSPAFPSGHTLNSWVLWILIGYLVAVRTGSHRLTVVALAVATMLAMGLSRVYLGHHWFTDVLVGWTLGAAWLAVIVTGHRLTLTVRRWTSGSPEASGVDAGGRPLLMRAP